MIKNLKKQRGIVVSDATIAIMIILLFAGIITTLITNIILEITKMKIYSQQMDYITEIFELAEKTDYEKVTDANLVKCINEKGDTAVSAKVNTTAGLTTPYKIAIKVEKYKDIGSKEFDLIKIITVTVENNLQEKSYTTTMSRLKKASLKEAEAIVK